MMFEHVGVRTENLVVGVYLWLRSHCHPEVTQI